MSGGYSFIDVDAWKEFAMNTDLVFAGYNDAIIYGEMIVICSEKIEKEFRECDAFPEENLNEGNILDNINSWVDVAAFIDNDELFFPEQGTLYIF